MNMEIFHFLNVFLFCRLRSSSSGTSSELASTVCLPETKAAKLNSAIINLLFVPSSASPGQPTHQGRYFQKN